MPTYDLKCAKCGKKFTAFATIKERENGKIRCPECGSNDIKQLFKSLNVLRGNSTSDISAQAACGGNCSACRGCH